MYWCCEFCRLDLDVHIRTRETTPRHLLIGTTPHTQSQFFGTVCMSWDLQPARQQPTFGCCTRSSRTAQKRSLLCSDSSRVRLYEVNSGFGPKLCCYTSYQHTTRNLPQTSRVACCYMKCDNNTTIQQCHFAPRCGVRKRWVLWVLGSAQQCNNCIVIP